MDTTPQQLSHFKNARDPRKTKRVPFEFTYGDWVAWWVNKLGPNYMDEIRANPRLYRMIRLDNTKPFSPDNTDLVKCLQSSSDDYKKRKHFLNTSNYYSKKRGIEFNFTFEDWVDYWTKKVGPDYLDKIRASPKLYRMFRVDNTKPVCADNVTIKSYYNGKSSKR